MSEVPLSTLQHTQMLNTHRSTLSQEEFGLVIPGMFFFRSLSPFSEVHAHFSLSPATDHLTPTSMPTSHSHSLEGLVTCYRLSLAVLTTRATPASDDRCAQVYARYRWDVNAEFSSIEGALAAQVLLRFSLFPASLSRRARTLLSLACFLLA